MHVFVYLLRTYMVQKNYTDLKLFQTKLSVFEHTIYILLTFTSLSFDVRSGNKTITQSWKTDI